MARPLKTPCLRQTANTSLLTPALFTPGYLHLLVYAKPLQPPCLRQPCLRQDTDTSLFTSLVDARPRTPCLRQRYLRQPYLGQATNTLFTPTLFTPGHSHLLVYASVIYTSLVYASPLPPPCLRQPCLHQATYTPLFTQALFTPGYLNLLVYARSPTSPSLRQTANITLFTPALFTPALLTPALRKLSFLNGAVSLIRVDLTRNRGALAVSRSSDPLASAL
jgi:hypothetical protein